MFKQPTWNTFCPTSPLFSWGLLEINRKGHQTFITSPLRGDQQIVNYIKGVYYLDEQLATFVVPIDPPNSPLPASQQGIVKEILAYLQNSLQGHSPIIQLLGRDGSSKQLIAAQTATLLGFQLYRLPSDLLPSQIVELETFLRRCNREGKLIPMDSAFLRRLRFIINFPFPSRSQRKQMWQKAFPEQTPIEALDFEHLGGFTLTGGSIHNIALNAAFLAAQAGTPVTMSLVLSAAKTEFRKLQRSISESDFQL